MAGNLPHPILKLYGISVQICVTCPLVPHNGTAQRHLRKAGLRNLRINRDEAMAEKRTMRRFSVFVLVFAIFIILFWLFSGTVLSRVGQLLILDQKPTASDAVVVLCTGVEYYPRLVEAADLFRKGLAKKVVINGNRKTDALRSLEGRGFKECCPWYEDSVRILEILGVPRKKFCRLKRKTPTTR